MKRSPILLLFLALLLSLAFAACRGGNDDATPSPTTEPTSSATPTPTEPADGGGGASVGPPAVTARASAGSIVMGEGTYCWTTAGVAGLCADKLGILTPVHVFRSSVGESIELSGDLDWLGARALSLQVARRPAAPVSSGPDWLAYIPEEAPTDVAYTSTATGMSFELPEPGSWLLVLSIAEARGDAVYGLLIDQRATSAGDFRSTVGIETVLDFGTEILFEGTPYSLELAAIEGDSRCPVDVTCVRAGDTTIVIAAKTDTEAELFTLVVPNGGEIAVDIDATYRVRVIGVSPEANSKVELRPENYSVLVVLERADAASTGSGVHGLVTVGPSCPVQRADMPCPDRPYPAELVVRDRAGAEVERTEASTDGWYEIELAPGTYVLDPLSPSGSPLPSSQPVEFTVSAGAWTALDVSYDSGIR